MTPLVAAPNQGYPDWQRIVNWDSPTLWAVPNSPQVTGFQSPVLNVSRYGYLGGRLGLDAGTAYCTILWFSDAAGTLEVGQYTITLAQAVTNLAQFRIPNLGPYCQLQFTSLLAPNFTPRGLILATNRPHPLPLVPLNAWLIQTINQALGASLTATLAPSDYYAGPADVWFFGSQLDSVTFYSLSYAGNYQQFEFMATSTNANSSKQIMLPGGAWEVIVANANGLAGTFSLTVVPSLTGG